MNILHFTLIKMDRSRFTTSVTDGLRMSGMPPKTGAMAKKRRGRLLRYLPVILGMGLLSVPVHAEEADEIHNLATADGGTDKVQGEGAEANVHEDLPAPAAFNTTVPAKPEEQIQVTIKQDASDEERELLTMLQLPLEELLNMKVTVASKEEEGVNVAPSSVTVYTRDDIQRLGIRTVERLLNFVPGFQGTTDAGNGMFRLSTRGRNTTAHEYVLVLVDGQRLSDIHSGSAIDPIAIENIEQVEIVRGPGSALYGANAFLGVINIKTNRQRSNIVAGIGHLNNRYLAANLAKEIGDLKIAGFAKFYSDDGFTYPNVIDINGRPTSARDPVREVDGYLTFDYKELVLHAWHLERAFSGISCCTPYSTYSNQTEQHHSSARLTYHWAVAHDLDIDIGAALARDRSMAIGPKLPVGAVPDVRSGVTLAETYIFGTDWSGLTVDGNLDLRWRLLSVDWFKASVMTGGSYEYTKVTNADDISSHDPSWQYQGDLNRWPLPQMDRTTAAGYLQARVDLLSRAQLTAGARYDWYSDFGHSFNPRAALVLRTPNKSHVKFMVGRAFRAPSFGELYDRPVRTSTTVSANLQPEVVTTYEVGYTQPFRDYAQSTLTFFHTNIRDIIQPPENLLPYRNLGSSIMNGLELELRTRDVFGFNLLASYTHLFPRDEEKKGLTVPFDFGSVALSYMQKWLLVDINAVLRSASRVGGHVATDITGTTFLVYDQPAYVLLGSHLQVEVLSPIKLFVVMENILNHRFERVNELAPPPGLLRRGRTFMVGVRAGL
jgi:outer membrane receptor for ferrienterochelin and colicins